MKTIKETPKRKEISSKTKKIIIAAISGIIVIAIVVGCIMVINKNSRKYNVTKITEYNYYTMVKNGKTGIIDKQGNLLIEPTYASIRIPNPEKPVFVCISNYDAETGKYESKVVNEKNEEIFKEYEQVDAIYLKEVVSNVPYEKTVLKFKKDNKYGLIDLNGKIIVKPIYDDISNMPYKEGELIVKQNDKYGVINIKGTVLVEIKYDSITGDNYYSKETEYKEDGYIVGIKTEEGFRYGYINAEGKMFLKTEYNKVYRMTDIEETDSYLVAEKSGQAGLYKNDKNILEHQYQGIEYDDINKLLVVEKNAKYGVMDITGKVILTVDYDTIDIEGIYIYGDKDNQTFVYDTKGNKQDTPKYSSVIPTENEKYNITIDNNGKYGIETKEGQILVTNKYNYIEYLYDNYFIAGNAEGKSGIINDKDEVKVSIQYDVIQKLDNCDIIQTILSNNNILELFDRTMSKLISLADGKLTLADNYIKVYSSTQTKYFGVDGKEKKNTELFSNNTLYAKEQNGKWGFVDKQGNTKVDFTYDKVTEVNAYGFAGVRMNDKWGVMNAKGEIIVEPIYQLDERNGEPDFIGKYYKVISGYGEQYYTDDTVL